MYFSASGTPENDESTYDRAFAHVAFPSTRTENSEVGAQDLIVKAKKVPGDVSMKTSVLSTIPLVNGPKPEGRASVSVTVTVTVTVTVVRLVCPS